MVGTTALWLPVLLSAVIVFLASSVIHMGLRYHKNDWTRLPGEDQLREAFRKAGVGPGEYAIPHCASPAEMQKPEHMKKYNEGPVGFITVLPSGPPGMTKNLVQWFLFTVVVGVFVAYVAGRTFGSGAEYLQVFRIAGTAAFLAYAGSVPVESIWKGRKWSTTIKFVIDGLVYALLTAGVFGWLWPR